MRHYIDIAACLNEGITTEIDTPGGLGVRVYMNPNKDQAKTLARDCLRRRGRVAIRGLITEGSVLAWDAWLATHADVHEEMCSSRTDVKYFSIEPSEGKIVLYVFARNKEDAEDNIYIRLLVDVAQAVLDEHNGVA